MVLSVSGRGEKEVEEGGGRRSRTGDAEITRREEEEEEEEVTDCSHIMNTREAE